MSNTPRTGLAPEKPTIKILIYTDDPQIALTNDFGQFFGLGSMKDRLLAHKPTFATVDFKWFSRNSSADNHADNKLNDILSSEHFDEIWFFGMHQCNTNNFSLAARQGGPHSELEEDEIAALTEWMRIREDGYGGGGILMTGDHANENPLYGLASTNGNHANPAASEEFLGIGRALGRGVPRAGALRKWEGPPTYHSDGSLSTISKGGFQSDRLPQQLELGPVDVNGDPDPDGQPHPLFFYKEGRFIEFFPDHAHEGAVVVPDEAALDDHDRWPCDASERQVLPQVVAFGRDARKPDDRVNIIATYNGDRAGVGRIVADSTWHHYTNLNLRGFPHDAAQGSESDQIGQFYANLAVWLAPKCKRQAMARLMFWELAPYILPTLLEEGEDAESTGATQPPMLSMAASPCELHELMQVYTPTEVVNLFDAGEIQLPSKEKLIGWVLKSYNDVIRNTGFKRAFEEHRGEVRNTLQALSDGPIMVNATSACDDASEQWTIETLSDRPGPLANSLFVFCLRTNAAGEISGTVSDGDSGDLLGPVTGTLTSRGSLDAGSSMTLEFRRERMRVRIFGDRTGNNFVGRFTNTVAAAEAVATSTSSRLMAVALAAPGDGDTGSASGTQT